MTETVEQEALRKLNEIRDDRGFDFFLDIDREGSSGDEALCRLIEERRTMEADHQAFREKVSEAMLVLQHWCTGAVEWAQGDRCKTAQLADGRRVNFSDFILPPPVDPLVEAFPAVSALIRYHESGGHEGDGGDDTLRKAKAELRSELAKHGLKIERTEA